MERVPVEPIVNGATCLQQGRIMRLYDALCHAPRGGLTTSQIAGRTGIKRAMAYRLLRIMEDAGLALSRLDYPPIGASRTGACRWWRRVGAV